MAGNLNSFALGIQGQQLAKRCGDLRGMDQPGTFTGGTKAAHQGGALLDLGRVSEALEFYKRCADSPAAAGIVAHGARVRMATCLAALKRPADILALLPPEPPADWHPEMLLHVEIGRAHV
jgi:hypothetical protein